MSSQIQPSHPGAGAAPSRRAVGEPPSELHITSYARGGRVTVVVAGEIDLDTAPQLQHALTNALRRSPAGVDVDLGRVPFCDCTGLNALLHGHRCALGQGKTLVVRNAGAAVTRLLALTRTLGPLTSPADAPSAVVRQRKLEAAAISST
ncbi:STAS domain-containing protein [Streptomyces sp. NPDC007172]|uniref:STAS domain-containing protein n=1 Tax=Streptomyces sp. NPDC007172 TaxID=3364776 RepID=UPI0036ADD804